MSSDYANWMTGEDFRALKVIQRHEGFSNFPIPDRGGTVVIGYGTNLTRRGIHPSEAAGMALRDIREACDELSTYSFWASIGPARRVALLDMAYCLGIAGLSKFSRMLAYLGIGNYLQAASELLASDFAVQVRVRATELAVMIRTGEFLAEDSSDKA